MSAPPSFPPFGPGCACHPPTSWWRPEQAAAAQAEGPRRHGPSLLNTFTRTKVPFVPLDGNRVGWYICGPTVYDSAHMGHARNYVNFDVLRKVMSTYFRYDVRFVMNVTDIDDKIVMRAHLRRSEGVLVEAGAEQFKGNESVQKAAQPLKDLLASGEKSLGEQERLTDDLAELLRLADPSLVPSASAEAGNTTHHLSKQWGIQSAYLELAHRFEAEFMEDMRLMGVLKPDMLTRVSEYTDKIVSYIQQIIERGYAYASNGSVYFDVPTFEKNEKHKYAKLNKSALENLELAMDGEGALCGDATEKRAENDFVLWKKSKPGEPAWDSPWGMGRPGWHIECSAMCSDVLGETVDINGGGIDLNFPHHENQLAQSEAFFDCEQWVNTFIHTGHLHIDGLKMSKSLKNFITIGATLKMYTARQVRFLFLIHQWSDPMDLTPVEGVDGTSGERSVVGFKQMDQALGVEKVFVEFFHAVKGVMRRTPGGYSVEQEHTWGDEERVLSTAIDTSNARTHAAMVDNINTPAVIKALKDLVGATNVYLGKVSQKDVRPLLIDSAARYVTTILCCLGVAETSSKVGFGEIGADADKAKGSGGVSSEETLAPALDLIIKFRDEIRSLTMAGATKSELMRACDNLRDVGLPDLGVKLDDKEGGALWKMTDKEALRKELERDAEAKQKKESETRLKKEEAVRKLAEKEAAAKIDPAEMFKLGEYSGVFSEYDEDGIPTKTKEGEEVAKAQRKKLAKAHSSQKAAHEKWLAKNVAEGVAKVSL